MKGKPSLLLTVALVSSSFGGPTLAHAEEVNLSRLRVTAVMPPQPTANPLSVYQAVDPTVMDAFCGDGDGCFIRLEEVHAAPDLRQQFAQPFVQTIVGKTTAGKLAINPRLNCSIHRAPILCDSVPDKESRLIPPMQYIVRLSARSTKCG